MVMEFWLARWFLTGPDDALQFAGSFLEYFSFLTKGRYRYFKSIEMLKILIYMYVDTWPMAHM